MSIQGHLGDLLGNLFSVGRAQAEHLRERLRLGLVAEHHVGVWQYTLQRLAKELHLQKGGSVRNEREIKHCDATGPTKNGADKLKANVFPFSLACFPTLTMAAGQTVRKKPAE